MTMSEDAEMRKKVIKIVYEHGLKGGCTFVITMILLERGIRFSGSDFWRIFHCDDWDTIYRWMNRIVTVTSIDELFA